MILTLSDIASGMIGGTVIIVGGCFLRELSWRRATGGSKPRRCRHKWYHPLKSAFNDYPNGNIRLCLRCPKKQKVIGKRGKHSGTTSVWADIDEAEVVD